ncbi:MAG: hypothetical protein NTZ15_02050 [Burkholderiales bacterium]|nr:hypothetical protein [Burkholderiales bacterium]
MNTLTPVLPASASPESTLVATAEARALAPLLMVRPDGKLLGVVNSRDGLRALLAAGNHEEALLRDYVMGIGYQ